MIDGVFPQVCTIGGGVTMHKFDRTLGRRPERSRAIDTVSMRSVYIVDGGRSAIAL